MLKIMALRSRFGRSLSTLAALLRWNLFAYRNLWDWMYNSYCPLPQEDPIEHLSFFHSALKQHPSQPQGGTEHPEIRPQPGQNP